MKKLFLLLLMATTIGCSTNLFIPISDVKLTNKENNFILGTNKLNVVISKVLYNPATSSYLVWGYTDLLQAPDRDYAKNPKIPIKRIRRGDTTLYGYSQKWGTFKIKMYSIDTIMFDYDQFKLLTIKRVY